MKPLLKNSKLLALIIFLYSLFQRVILDIAFWEKYGPNASHLTEIWIYCKKALSTQPLKKDLTLYILRLMGQIFPEQYLLHVISILAAVLSSLTAVIIFYLVKNLINTPKEKESDDFVPLAAAFFYTGIFSVQALSLVSFTHDLLQMPITLGFLTAATALIQKYKPRKTFGLLRGKQRKEERVSKKRLGYYLISSLLLAWIGYHINPVFLLALPLLAVYILFSWKKCSKEEKSTQNLSLWRKINPQIYFYLILIFTLILGRYVFYEQAVNLLHFLLSKYQGIDLRYILTQNSKDLVPTDMDKKFLDLYVLCFFIPFGFYAAWRKKETLGPTLLIISYFLAATIDRGSRLLNIGAAIMASYAFCFRRKFYILDYLLAAILILAFLLNPGSSILKNQDKVLYLLIPLILLWAFKKYFQKYGKITSRRLYNAALITILLLPSFSALFLYKYWVHPALTQGEYEMASWIKNNTKAEEKIFLNWGEAHYYDFLTGLNPVNRLAQTSFDQNKIYWQPEEEAVDYAQEQGIRYFLVNSTDFAAQKLPDGRFAYSFRGASPSLSTEEIINSFLYALVIEPKNLKKVELLHQEEDRATGKWVRLFKIKEY